MNVYRDWFAIVFRGNFALWAPPLWTMGRVAWAAIKN